MAAELLHHCSHLTSSGGADGRMAAAAAVVERAATLETLKRIPRLRPETQKRRPETTAGNIGVFPHFPVSSSGFLVRNLHQVSGKLYFPGFLAGFLFWNLLEVSLSRFFTYTVER
jgi:hypothetical protein